ncbi:hypothetical protein ACCAA_130052 [Candidatus Accumulibacter aalborgensis]|uniref:Uncharacterized protein n=1 Tax=Candidatus Accumulibacter aalborgensis TaxID=1860102 RepID=A0A1A8XFW8_9PROT|nr:hypothetical protein ACCAA_130052 [Candidatus Accumulibacter aalborgensis]
MARAFRTDEYTLLERNVTMPYVTSAERFG